MTEIINFEQEKIDREQPTLEEIIDSFASNNCDPNRPYREQQPKRAALEVKGLSMRDIMDCMVLGILECKQEDESLDFDHPSRLPRIYVSEKGNKFKSWKELIDSGEGYNDSYPDPERVTYNDVYGWDLDSIDPVAAIRNGANHIERRMGIFPALLDGGLKIIEIKDE